MSSAPQSLFQNGKIKKIGEGVENYLNEHGEGNRSTKKG